MFSSVGAVCQRMLTEAMKASDSSAGDGEFECMNGNVGSRTGCILTYNGSILDGVLNYTVFLVNLVYCYYVIQRRQQKHYRQENVRRFCVGALLGVILFQIGLCLILGCSGISIVWCSMGGWLMRERRTIVEGHTSVEHGSGMESTGSSGRIDATSGSTASWSLGSVRLRDYGKMVILVDQGVIIYYVFALPPITTVAHVCALVLGAMLNTIAQSLAKQDESMSSSSEVALDPSPGPATHLLSEASASSNSNGPSGRND